MDFTEDKTSSEQTTESNSLTNVVINVLIPVLALSHLSKDEGAFWHIGPLNALIIAVSFPLVYGIWDLLATRKVNTFSVLGIASVVLTGGLTLYLWNDDGTVKDNAPLVFASKEAIVPLILGVAIFIGGVTKGSLFRLFLYTDSFFDIKLIEDTVEDKQLNSHYEKALKQGALVFIGSFLLSSILNFIIAMYFLNQVDYSAVTAKVDYNEAIGKITGYGYLLIGLPLIGCTLFAVKLLSKKIIELTQLPKDKVSFTGL